MNVKCFMPFVLLFSLVSCGLAIPTPGPRDDRLPPKEVDESVNEITKDVEKAAKKLVDNFQWIYRSFGSIAKTTFQEASMDYHTRLEILSMADGFHVSFPLSEKPEIKQDCKTVAIAVSKLMMNLKTMERTDKVMKNVSRHFDDNIRRMLKEYEFTRRPTTTSEEWINTLTQVYFETLDHQMEADEDLQAEYKQRKIEAREEVKRDPQMREPWLLKYLLARDTLPLPIEDFKIFMEDAKTLRLGFANKLFLKQSAKHFQMIFSPLHHQRYLMTRALIQKARFGSKNDSSKINEVYNRALVRAGKIPMITMIIDNDKVLNELFNSIERDLESDPTLNAKIHTTMKQIEGSTVYDSDMFSVDLAWL